MPPISRVKQTSYDWGRIRERMVQLDNGSPATQKEMRQYRRFTRFVWNRLNTGDVDDKQPIRDAILSIADEFRLSPIKVRKLISGLERLRFPYLSLLHVHNQPTKVQWQKALSRLKNPVHHIANFHRRGGEPEDIAMSFLAARTKEWARSQDRETLKQFGFDLSPVRNSDGSMGETDHGAYHVIRNWLALAPHMNNWISRAESCFAKEPGKGAIVSNGLAPAAHLAGVELPELYRRITGQRFCVSKAGDGQSVKETTGVRFVRLAMEAMKISPLATETIAAYFKLARKRRKLKSGV